MSKVFRPLIVLFLLVVTVLAVPLHYVWLPDVFSNSEHQVGSVTLTGGDRLCVAQEWNHSDFYSTYLKYIDPRGEVKIYPLDGDDIKRWSCTLKVDSRQEKAEVIIGGEPRGTYLFKDGIFKNPDGRNVEPVSQ